MNLKFIYLSDDPIWNWVKPINYHVICRILPLTSLVSCYKWILSINSVLQLKKIADPSTRCRSIFSPGGLVIIHSWMWKWADHWVSPNPNLFQMMICPHVNVERLGRSMSLWLVDGLKPGSISALLPQYHGPV